MSTFQVEPTAWEMEQMKGSLPFIWERGRRLGLMPWDPWDPPITGMKRRLRGCIVIPYLINAG